jgi:UPF0755 protein
VSGRYPDDEWPSIESSSVDDYDALTRRRSDRRPPRARRRAGFLLLAVIAFVIGLGVGYARAYFAPGDEGPKVTVTIPEGATLTVIGQALEAKGVVKHARAFVIKAQSDGYATQFKAGTYELHENEPYESLVDALAKGAKSPGIKVTVQEGSTLERTADIAAAAVPTITQESYVKVARDNPPPFKLKGYKAGTTLEGMLFPATYELASNAKASMFVNDQLEAFTQNFGEVDLARAHKANLTDYDVVIIASMVEREARVAQERPVVAAVIWNRLREGMLLQIDATVQYALGGTKPELTYEDLKIDSPYNTYKHAGLPPTPIANPGLAALQAAADPSAVDYLYYVARNDGTGRHYFTADYDQFLVDKAKAAANGQ